MDLSRRPLCVPWIITVDGAYATSGEPHRSDASLFGPNLFLRTLPKQSFYDHEFLILSPPVHVIARRYNTT
jgi:hypothetical protein